MAAGWQLAPPPQVAPRPQSSYHPPHHMGPHDPDATTRIDRWLWAARAFRSRSLAAQACDGGKVTVNDATAKPHKLIRPGDLIAIRSADGTRRWRVLVLDERRGPARVARTLYEDLTPPPPPGQPFDPTVPRRERGMGRPTKRERRQLDRLR